MNDLECDKMVIAHFAKQKSLPYALLFLIACALLYAATLYHPSGVSLHGFFASRALHSYEFAVVGWICGALLIVRQLTILNQVVLHRSNALWISGERLFYLNIYSNVVYKSIPLSDIAGFDIRKGFAARAGIVVRLCSGRERVISTWLIAESADEVIARLKFATRRTRCVQRG